MAILHTDLLNRFAINADNSSNIIPILHTVADSYNWNRYNITHLQLNKNAISYFSDPKGFYNIVTDFKNGMESWYNIKLADYSYIIKGQVEDDVITIILYLFSIKDKNFDFKTTLDELTCNAYYGYFSAKYKISKQSLVGWVNRPLSITNNPLPNIAKSLFTQIITGNEIMCEHNFDNIFVNNIDITNGSFVELNNNYYPNEYIIGTYWFTDKCYFKIISYQSMVNISGHKYNGVHTVISNCLNFKTVYSLPYNTQNKYLNMSIAKTANGLAMVLPIRENAYNLHKYNFYISEVQNKDKTTNKACLYNGEEYYGDAGSNFFILDDTGMSEESNFTVTNDKLNNAYLIPVANSNNASKFTNLYMMHRTPIQQNIMKLATNEKLYLCGNSFCLAD